ncbi:outer membrane transport energization protein TonB [Candidatus Koribacter versatilis Ellin345]|uniref:Outer membrane transport energization protein TonB n=2 Tax=Candidatus Korobacter versatilis TaxID=658062 RepID=Q1IV50_KORVE|nr:outer membrane transport energization protein TonB [Candidatus Koribacter versatilis Ellin345]
MRVEEKEHTMFEQSLVEISAETKRRKRWTQLISYSLEATAVVVLLAFPLVHTEALPLDDSPKIFPPIYHAPPHVDVITEHAPAPRPVRDNHVMINPYLAPTSVGKTIDRSHDADKYSAAEELVCVGCIPDPTGTDSSRHNPVLESVLRPGPVQPTHRAAPVTRTSKSQESLLLRQVKPTYPRMAVMTRTQGVVQLHAIIGRDGSIQQLQVVSGSPFLVQAALEAVQQWKYRPYLLNGEPVEVETQITVNFTLNGN